jgi:hypothetical protein
LVDGFLAPFGLRRVGCLASFRVSGGGDLRLSRSSGYSVLTVLTEWADGSCGGGEWVLLPVAVNMASSALYELVRRLVVRAGSRKEVSEVEVVEFTSGGGDRVLVVRARREVS